MAQFEASAGTSFRTASSTVQPFNDSLLSSRESVRLLSEEMGVRLPRAVSSAIAEMLPDIASLGTGLLGVFAIEEVIKWGKAAVEEMHELQGETKELKKDWEDVIKEQEKLLRNPKILADALKDLDETQKRLSDVAKHITDLKAEQAALSPIMVGAIAGYASAITDAEAEQAKLVEREIAQEDTKVKLLHEAEKEGNDAAKAVLENYRQQGEAAKKYELLSNEAAMAVLTNYREQQKAVLSWAREQEQLKNLEQDHIAHLREEDGWWIKIEGDIAKEGRALENERHAMEILNRQRDELFKRSRQLREEYHESHLVFDDFTRAIREQVKAISEHAAASVEELTTGLASLIGGRKAQAGVEAIWEGAKGVACLAEGTWPPNPAAIIAAGLHFESAAQYALLGGGGGSSRYSSASAAAGPAAMTAAQLGSLPGLPSGWTYNQYGTPIQMAGGLASPVSGNVTVVVGGDAKIAAWVADVVNTAVLKNDVKLTATHVKYPSPVRR
jgi:hypothetical protein